MMNRRTPPHLMREVDRLRERHRFIERLGYEGTNTFLPIERDEEFFPSVITLSLAQQLQSIEPVYYLDDNNDWRARFPPHHSINRLELRRYSIKIGEVEFRLVPDDEPMGISLREMQKFFEYQPMTITYNELCYQVVRDQDRVIMHSYETNAEDQERRAFVSIHELLLLGETIKRAQNMVWLGV